MSGTENEQLRDFSLGYDTRRNVFTAHIYESDHRHSRLIEDAYSLEDLFAKCRARGLTLYSIGQPLIDLTNHWLADLPAVQYLEGRWGETGPSKRGPMGFAAHIQNDETD